jgi:hypothetical protein
MQFDPIAWIDYEQNRTVIESNLPESAALFLAVQEQLSTDRYVWKFFLQNSETMTRIADQFVRKCEPRTSISALFGNWYSSESLRFDERKGDWFGIWRSFCESTG